MSSCFLRNKNHAFSPDCDDFFAHPGCGRKRPWTGARTATAASGAVGTRQPARVSSPDTGIFTGRGEDVFVGSGRAGPDTVRLTVPKPQTSSCPGTGRGPCCQQMRTLWAHDGLTSEKSHDPYDSERSLRVQFPPSLKQLKLKPSAAA